MMPLLLSVSGRVTSGSHDYKHTVSVNYSVQLNIFVFIAISNQSTSVL